MVTRNGLAHGADGLRRCFWGTSDDAYQRYHDTEWGYPVVDDRRLFEKICLEGFQAGLSWLTILRKRENFRRAFERFDPKRVSRFTGRDVTRLLSDDGIVRHRGKIESTINNAHRALALQKEFNSLARYFWTFEPGPRDRPRRITWEVLKAMPSTELSKRLSKDLKRRGWTFVGPTTVYAFMQAMGLVNDHIAGCHFRDACQDARKRLVLP